ncbi:hypothetical protein ARMSODRAFT_1026897 [Armillaria solidipes]|uniref:Uncharacterized protein n=1 Tax=Armillaria solidipes TaxID=1076256 RepID=A0A2H3AMP7_9AGAR|nr:hypothetical protein ARMSODRAFT_1026897 [Armillaria solidipes]
MSFPTSNPDHSWNEWIRNNAPRGGPCTNRTPPTNTYPETQPRDHRMFQKPPPPAYNPAAEDYGRYLRDRFRSPTPDLPLITIPDSPASMYGVLGNESPAHAPSPTGEPDPANPELIWVNQPCTHTLPAGPIRIMFTPPPHLCPLPDSDSDSDSSDYGGNKPVPEREDDDPLNPYGGDYEWPSLDAIDQAALGPYRSQAWEIRRVDVENRSRHEGPKNRVPMGYYLAIARGPLLPRRGRDAAIQA